MWCVPKLTPEFIERMEHILDLYALPDKEKEPVVCIDEKNKQLTENIRSALPTTEYALRRTDYEYKRNGTRNIFCAVEPKGGRRRIAVTRRRTKRDFSQFVKTIIEADYPDTDLVHIVCDNLNTHFAGSLYETFGQEKGARLASRIRFHYTPKHASWLDMAEIELSVLSRTAIRGRVPTEEDLVIRTQRFERARNERHAMIRWKFTKDDARRVMNYQVQN